MANPEDRRIAVRLSLDAQFTIRYEVEGRVFRGIEMTNISVGGLGIKLAHRQAVRLQQGVILRNMVFEHPSLPQVRVDGEVRHIMGQTLQNAEGLVLVGVQYCNPSPGLVESVEAFIERRLESAG